MKLIIDIHIVKQLLSKNWLQMRIFDGVFQ